MEVMIFIIFFSLVFITTFALWKYVRLEHDVYEYTEKLDNTINYIRPMFHWHMISKFIIKI